MLHQRNYIQNIFWKFNQFIKRSKRILFLKKQNKITLIGKMFSQNLKWFSTLPRKSALLEKVAR